jgi:ribulose-bisphosphate carboxylase small chain
MVACAAIVSAPVVAVCTTMKPASKAANTKAVAINNLAAKKATAFKVWTPINNKMFETFSFLPPLSNEDITKQVDYIVRNGWTPCLEFANPELAYVSNENCTRFNNTVTYQDNRYWTMWKLPMFGCTDGAQVIGEVEACTKAFPDAYIRLVAFDASRQVQVAGFLVHRPVNATEFKAPSERSV